MLTKRFTTLSIATLATLGAFAVSVEQASARPGGGGHGGHGMGSHRMGGHVAFHGGRGGHWGHRGFGYGWGFYGAPLIASAAYVPDCYYIRRRGLLYKVCE